MKIKTKDYHPNRGEDKHSHKEGHTLILQKRRYKILNGSGMAMPFTYESFHWYEGLNCKISDSQYKKEMFVYLNFLQRQKLQWMFCRHLLQKNKFWMWVVNISIAGLAVIMSYLNLHQSNKIDKMELKMEMKEQQIQNKEKEILKLNDRIRAQELKNKNDTLSQKNKQQ